MSTRPVAATLIAALLLLAGSAHALQGPGAAPAPAAPGAPASGTATPASPPGPVVRAPERPADRVPERPQTPLEVIVAQSIVRVALVDLKVNQDPQPGDFVVASALLQSALRGTPDDQDIVRLAADAAEQAGDRDGVERLTRELLRLDPSDSVAQLSLISSRIGRLQNARERATSYEQLLGPRGQQIDESVRSRLALDAAVLARELGDSAQFVARLGEATRLDPTNKDAAALAYAFFSQRVDDPVGRLELLISLLKADPLDSQTHLAIARELASAGAAAQSVRFLQNAASIDGRSGLQLSADRSNEESVQLWFARGPEWVIEDISKVVRGARGEIESLRRRLTASGQPLTGVAEPESIRLELSTERIRLAAASASGNTAAAAESSSDMLRSVQDLDTWLVNPSRRPRRYTEELLRSEIEYWSVESVWLNLLANQQIDLAEKQLAALTAGSGKVSRAVGERLAGWLALRKGDLDKAERVLKALDKSDPLATLGLGVLAEAREDRSQAVARYVEVWLAMPDSYIGQWARTRGSKLTESPWPMPASSAKLGALAQGVPAWLDKMITDPRSFMTLTAEPLSKQLGPFEPARVRVRLRNVGPIPLALGADKPLNARLLFTPQVESGKQTMTAQAVPEVVTLNRRLRLRERETLEATVWVEPGFGGWALGLADPGPWRQRWRMLQGFRIDGEGITLPGVFSLAVEVPMVQRQGLNAPMAETGVLAQSLRAAQGQELANALGVAAIRLQRVGQPDGLKQDEARVLIGALLTRYSAENAQVRSLMLARLPVAALAPSMEEFDEAVKKIDEADAGVMLLKVVTRVRSANDPLLNAARAMTDSSLRAAVDAHEARLRASTRVYSTWGYLIGPTQLGAQGTPGAAPSVPPAPAPPVAPPVAPAVAPAPSSTPSSAAPARP